MRTEITDFEFENKTWTLYAMEEDDEYHNDRFHVVEHDTQEHQDYLRWKQRENETNEERLIRENANLQESLTMAEWKITQLRGRIKELMENRNAGRLDT